MNTGKSWGRGEPLFAPTNKATAPQPLFKGLLPAPRFLLLLGITLLLLGCDSADTTRQVVLTRPGASGAAAPGGSTALPAPSATARQPLRATATLPPPATPTLSPQIAEYAAVVQYWQASVALSGQIDSAYNDYIAKTTAYDTFDTYQQHKDIIVPISDQLVTAIDKNVAALQALKPPSPATAYHNATLQYWQEYRAYVSDLRQGIDHNNTDLWNQGIARQPRIANLEATREAEQAKLYNDYIIAGRAK